MFSESSSAPAGVAEFVRKKIFITEVPPYGNSIFYSLGFLGLVCFTLLLVSGIAMVLMGGGWWLTDPRGIFFRSIHLWAAQAFVAVIILHVLVVFATSGFKSPRRLTWVIGASVFLLLLIEAEFGYYLRGDFSSQYRALQGADFWNGAYLGTFVNTLNGAEVFGIHVVFFPLVIVALLSIHYLLVKARGIASPYRSGVLAPMVPADHRKLFFRGASLAALIIVLAAFFPSPLIEPLTVRKVADDDPALFAQTIVDEFNRTSDTASYLDSIDPYSFDTREVYVSAPYAEYVMAGGGPDELAAFLAEPPAARAADAQAAEAYFKNGAPPPAPAGAGGGANPLISVARSLVAMGKSGLYQSALDAERPNTAPTYSLRFLSDTGVLEDQAETLHITTEQWGMMREEKGKIPPGAWWLAPLGFLDHTILANDSNGDRDGAEILGLLCLAFVFFPYLPYVNRLPEKLHLAELFWRAR